MHTVPRRPPEVAQPSFLLPAERPVLHAFLERRDKLQQLVDEVIYLLNHQFEKARIETAAVYGRVKSSTSLIDKMRRKRYSHALEQITDQAGVRVVCLYPRQLNAIDGVIEKTFAIQERAVKTSEQPDRFGYEANHYVVALRRGSSGIRSSILHHLVCEIQVRTVLQDAWAIIDHHLRYKREGAIQDQQKRRLHALAAVLETADDQVDEIVHGQIEYVKWLNKPRTTIRRLRREPVNDETILAYARKKFRSLAPVLFPQHVIVFLRNLDHTRFATLSSIDDAVEETNAARREFTKTRFARTGLAHIALAIACVDVEFRKRIVGSAEALAIAEKFRPQKLLKKRAG